MKITFNVVMVSIRYHYYDHNDNAIRYVAHDDVNQNFDTEAAAEACIQELFEKHSIIRGVRFKLYSKNKKSDQHDIESLSDQLDQLERDFFHLFGMRVDDIELYNDCHFQIQKRYKPD